MPCIYSATPSARGFACGLTRSLLFSLLAPFAAVAAGGGASSSGNFPQCFSFAVPFHPAFRFVLGGDVLDVESAVFSPRVFQLRMCLCALPF